MRADTAVVMALVAITGAGVALAQDDPVPPFASPEYIEMFIQPETPYTQICRCAREDCPGFRNPGFLIWNRERPDEIQCKACGTWYPSDEFPEDQSIEVDGRRYPYHEDAQGRPFVGRAGGLLTDMIEKGMRIDRADVYICNVLKCRPPGNRDPHPDEKEQCEPYLVKQLELLEPKVICALGAHAAHALLKVDTPIGRLRGKWHFYRGIPLRATYHPAYLLRSPGEKPRAWVDLQALMRLLGGYEQAVQPEAQPREPENLNLFS